MPVGPSKVRTRAAAVTTEDVVDNDPQQHLASHRRTVLQSDPASKQSDSVSETLAGGAVLTWLDTHSSDEQVRNSGSAPPRVLLQQNISSECASGIVQLGAAMVVRLSQHWTEPSAGSAFSIS